MANSCHAPTASLAPKVATNTAVQGVPAVLSVGVEPQRIQLEPEPDRPATEVSAVSAALAADVLVPIPIRPTVAENFVPVVPANPPTNSWFHPALVIRLPL